MGYYWELGGAWSSQENEIPLPPWRRNRVNHDYTLYTLSQKRREDDHNFLDESHKHRAAVFISKNPQINDQAFFVHYQ